MKKWPILGTISLILICITEVPSYPIDGYPYTNIRRLRYLELVVEGELKGTKPVSGAMKSIQDITLNLLGSKGDSLSVMPDQDPDLQKAINRLFPSLHESYSITILDITPGRPIRYAARKETAGYQPGSVGKLAVLAGMFAELAKLYPDSFELRQELLCTKTVRAGKWAMTDEHKVAIYDMKTQKMVKRQVRESDEFLLYEWLDYMMSVSNNGAASVCWRETILMRAFGAAYPNLTEDEAEKFFKETPKSELSDLANAVVNEPLISMCITPEEWRLGSLFTRGGTSYIPRKGGSIGTTLGLMKYLIAMERGQAIDEESSLEMKRLFYMTDRRIRYAASPALREAAVYFKSGSLYKCKAEQGFSCGKYMGNVDNFMNSVAIVEHPDSTTYLVALMSNVRKKNSSVQHMALAGEIDKVLLDY